MSSPFDAAIAAAWGRWLEGEPEPTDEGVLAGGLRLATGPDDDFTERLVDDEQLDRLLRRSLAPPAASEAFVAGVLAAIDLPPLEAFAPDSADPDPDLGGLEQTGGLEPPVIRIRTPSARVRPRPAWSDGGLLAATIAGLGLVAAVIALAVIQPWNRWARPPQQPAPVVRRPEPKPEPAPVIEPAPEPASPRPSYPPPDYPPPDYPRSSSLGPDPEASVPEKPAKRPADAAATSGTMPGTGSSVSISQQVINGRFQGTITIDGKTQTFDSRAAFEKAKRDLGR
jgi:hypothetical protein